MTGNILPKVSDSTLTHARPSKIPVYSSQEVLEQVPCLRLITKKKIKKDDQFVYIDDLKIDVTKLTVRELTKILETNGVETFCIEYIELLDLPAILLNNFSNKEYRKDNVKTNPIDLSYYNNIMNRSLSPISSSITPLSCTNTFTNTKAITELSNNYLFIKEVIDEHYAFLYCVTADDFIWNINYNHIITNSKEFVSKNMERVL